MARRFLEAQACLHPARVRTALPRSAVAALALAQQSPPAKRGPPSRAAMRSSTFALEPGFGENVGLEGPQVDSFDQDDRRVGLLHFVVDPDLRRVPEIALLGLAVLLLPPRVIEGAHQSTRQRELLPLEYVGGRGVDPQLDDRKRDVDAGLHLEVQSMDVIGAELVVALVAGDDKLGAYHVHRLNLKVKPGVDVAFPIVKLWVDTATSNVLKRQEFALSGRLMRTLYYPRWQKQYSESKKGDFWYPPEIRIYDEVEKANSTIVLIKTVDLRPLETNIFTKAWFESKSR